MTDRIRTAPDKAFLHAGVGHASARLCSRCGGRSCSYLGSKVLKRGPFIVGWVCGRCVKEGGK